MAFSGSISSESVPADRIIARAAEHRFEAIDLADPRLQDWARLGSAMGDEVRVLCYNKTQPDRACPNCCTQYLPLPEDVPASTAALERVEEERRLSGICSLRCWRSGGASDDDFATAPKRRPRAVPSPEARTAADIPFPLAEGSVYVIKGLMSRPDLNGCVAIAMGSSGELSTSPERAPVYVINGSGPPLSLSLKPSNLIPFPDALGARGGEAMAWSLRAPRPGRSSSSALTTLTEIIAGQPSVGSLDDCTEFASALLEAVRPASRSPRPRMRLFTRDSIRGILRSPGHAIYWFRFDAISHHFVVEVQDGFCRVFQSYVRALFTGDMRGPVTLGYTALAWATVTPDPQWALQQPALVDAHSRWGGGRVLPASELCALLMTYAELQDLSDKVVAEMLRQLPHDLLAQDAATTAMNERSKAAAQARFSAGAGGSSFIEQELSSLDKWAQSFIRAPQTISFLETPEGGMRIFSNAAYAGPSPISITISPHIISALSAKWFMLTGQAFAAHQCFAMLSYRAWRTCRIPFGDPRSPPRGRSLVGGSSEAMGWAFCETIMWR